MSGLNGDGVQVDNPRDIVFDFQCISSDLAGTISYKDVSGLQRRPCLAEYTDFPNYTRDIMSLIPLHYRLKTCSHPMVSKIQRLSLMTAVQAVAKGVHKKLGASFQLVLIRKETVLIQVTIGEHVDAVLLDGLIG